MYEVVIDFEDRQDHLHHYKLGEYYPRKGYKPDEGRIDQLLELGYIQDEEVE